MSDQSIWDTINTNLANVTKTVGVGKELYDTVKNAVPSRDILLGGPEDAEPSPTADVQPVYGPALPASMTTSPVMGIAMVVGLILVLKVL